MVANCVSRLRSLVTVERILGPYNRRFTTQNDILSTIIPYIIAQICSPLSHPVPLYGSKECYRNNQDTGYRCILRCHEGYMLPDHGWLTTVVCIDGGDWNQVIPACEPGNLSFLFHFFIYSRNLFVLSFAHLCPNFRGVPVAQ